MALVSFMRKLEIVSEHTVMDSNVKSVYYLIHRNVNRATKEGGKPDTIGPISTQQFEQLKKLNK